MITVVSKKTIRLDGDVLEIEAVYDYNIGKYIFDYPDFQKHPRSTPGGKKWVNALDDGCPYADDNYGDCGSCEYFKTESPKDLIGICLNEEFTVERNR